MYGIAEFLEELKDLIAYGYFKMIKKVRGYFIHPRIIVFMSIDKIFSECYYILQSERSSFMKGYTTTGVNFMNGLRFFMSRKVLYEPFLIQQKITLKPGCRMHPSIIQKGVMLMIRLNGKPLTNYDQKPLSQLLTDCQYDSAKIAVEKNGEIIPKNQYHTTILNSDDVLEVVSFVGGG